MILYNILICDDDKDIVNALKIFLFDKDYCFFEAFNGLEAFEVIKAIIDKICADYSLQTLSAANTGAKKAKRK